MNWKAPPPPSAASQTRMSLTPKLLSVDQTCASIGIGRTNFYHLRATNQIATVKIGRRTFVTTEALDAFIATLSAGSSL